MWFVHVHSETAATTMNTANSKKECADSRINVSAIDHIFIVEDANHCVRASKKDRMWETEKVNGPKTAVLQNEDLFECNTVNIFSSKSKDKETEWTTKSTSSECVDVDIELCRSSESIASTHSQLIYFSLLFGDSLSFNCTALQFSSDFFPVPFVIY